MPDLRAQLREILQGRVCLVGVGNTDRGDDGFGVRLAEAMAESKIRERVAELGKSARLRTVSPLTPALSPLRGEGGALLAPQAGCPSVSIEAAWGQRCGSNAAKRELGTEGARRAPSPLNGERAGVRGEDSRDLSDLAIASRTQQPKARTGRAEEGPSDCGLQASFGSRIWDSGFACLLVAGTTPERCWRQLADGGFEHVVFLDAVEFGGAPGAVVLLGAEEITTRFPQVSTHKLSLGLLARMVEASGRTKAWLLGVQSESLQPGGELSSAVRTTLDLLRQLISESFEPAPADAGLNSVRRQPKRQRAGALQDAIASFDGPPRRVSVVECASPLPLSVARPDSTTSEVPAAEAEVSSFVVRHSSSPC